MNFIAILLRGFAFIPGIVQGVEALFGAKGGAQKRESALAFASAALSITEAIAQREIADEEKFRDGLGKVIDGVVQCLNASSWSKQK